MDARNEENLKKLFEKFLDSNQAEEAAEDVRKGEQILREHPSPEPDDELVADIKAEIAEVLLRRKADTFKRIAYRAAAVAAMFILVAVISVKLFEKGGGKSHKVQYASIIPTAIWESDDIASDDTDLAILADEIEEIEGEALTVELGENGANGSSAIAELEMELMEINSNFWKG